MTYQNKHDKKGVCSKDGVVAEQLFHDLLKKLGDNPKEANKAENRRGIDFHSVLLDKVDVKAMKRTRRLDAKAQDDLIWVEFLNIGGGRGWLYKKSKYIAFERQKDFLLVERCDLATLCETLCDKIGRAHV